jgi:hypothetical protein
MQGGVPRIDWWLVIGTTFFFIVLARTRLYLHHDAILIPSMLIGTNRLALWLYALFMFPGTLLHELSHAGAALALLVDVHSFSVAPTDDVLGMVRIEKPDVVRSTIIGLAPLFVGTSIVLIVSALVFDLTHVYDALVQGNWATAANTVIANLSSIWEWAAVYVVFVVSANMFPSHADIPRWLQIVLLFLPVLIAGAISLAAPLAPWLVEATNTVFRWLLLIFGFTLAVDLPILLLLTASTEAIAKQFPGG